MPTEKRTRDYLRIIAKRRGTLLAVVLAALTAALALSLLMPAYYEAKITFYLPQAPSGQITLSSSPRAMFKPNIMNPVSNPDIYRGFVGILESASVAKEVADLVKTNRSPTAIKENTTVSVSSEGIFTLTIRDRSATLARDLVSNYPTAANNFLERTSFLGQGASLIRGYLEDQIRLTTARLDTAQRELHDFMATNHLVGMKPEVATVVKQNVDLQSQRYDARVALQENRIRTDAVAAQLGLAGADLLDRLLGENRRIGALRGQVARLEIRLAALLQRFTEEHPTIITLRAALEETQNKLREEVTAVVESRTAAANPIEGRLKGNLIDLAIERQVLLAKEGILSAEILRIEDDYGNISDLQYQFAKLQLRARLLVKALKSLAGKLEEMKLQETQHLQRFVILDPAVEPLSPAYPKLSINLLVAFGLSLFVGMFLALLWESAEERRGESRLRLEDRETLDDLFLSE